MTSFPLKIVTLDGLFYDGEVEEVVVRTTTGDMGVLAGHTNCVAPLGMGRATIVIDGKKRYASCIGGIIFVLDGEVKLVPTTFEWAEEIDIAQMSTYGYKTKGTNLFPHKKVVPMLYSSAWRNEKGNILLTFVNISEEAKDLHFTINPAELGIAANGTMFINGEEVAEWPEQGNEWSSSCRIEGCSVMIYELKNN